MALRLIEVIVPKEDKDKIKSLRNNPLVLDSWQEEIGILKFAFKFLVSAENSQKLIDKISRLFKKDEKFRIIVQDIEATLPYEEPPVQTTQKMSIGKLSVSREELYNQVTNMSQLNYIYLFMVGLSAIIAAFGFIEDNLVVIIGSMVVAPLIGPNIAFSLGVVLGDKDFALKGMLTMFAGVFLVLVISLIIGFFYPFDNPSNSIIASLIPNYSDIIVAFASGVAAIFAFTSGESFALIGVMVSISLLPPLVAAGLMLAKLEFLLFFNAMILFLINFVALNLSGVVTFWFQGVRPKNWWEEKKAKHYRFLAVSMWLFLLLILIIFIYFITPPINNLNF